MFRQNEPLWLPRGSVRALTMAALLAGCFYFSTRGGEPEFVMKWFDLTGLVVGYYIGARSKQ